MGADYYCCENCGDGYSDYTNSKFQNFIINMGLDNSIKRRRKMNPQTREMYTYFDECYVIYNWCGFCDSKVAELLKDATCNENLEYNATSELVDEILRFKKEKKQQLQKEIDMYNLWKKEKAMGYV
jgi:hypothetical protein